MSGGFGLVRYLRRYRREAIVGPLFKMLEAAFELIVPLLMARLIDAGVGGGDARVILTTGGLMVFMGVLGLVCSLTAQFFAAKAATGFGARLRGALFEHVGALSHAQIDRVGASTLITRLTADADRAQAGVNLVLRLFLRSPFIVVGAIAMALAIDKPLTLIFLAATPMISLVIWFVISRTIPGYRRIQAHLDGLSLIVRENLRGVRVIRAFSRQADEAGRFEEQADRMMDAEIVAGRISALSNPLTYALVNLSIMALLWFGGHRVDGGRISQGQLIALINYMTQILLALVALANLIVVFARAMASAARIEELFAVQPSVADGPGAAATAGAPRVEFDRVHFGYAGGRDVLADISFRAMPGQTVGIIGPTGSGNRRSPR